MFGEVDRDPFCWSCARHFCAQKELEDLGGVRTGGGVDHLCAELERLAFGVKLCLRRFLRIHGESQAALGGAIVEARVHRMLPLLLYRVGFLARSAPWYRTKIDRVECLTRRAPGIRYSSRWCGGKCDAALLRKNEGSLV